MVSYHEPVEISGHATRSRGVPVMLAADRFPFASGPAEVSRRRTGRRGAYSFRRRPSHATRYRVALVNHPSQASRILRVYVEPRVSRLRCNLCGASSHGRGNHTLRFSFRLSYPADTFGTEAPKPVYFYYGQRSGSAEPPKRLYLAETVEQRRLARHRTAVAITHQRPPAPPLSLRSSWRAPGRAKRVDGLGLPGRARLVRGCGDQHDQLPAVSFLARVSTVTGTVSACAVPVVPLISLFATLPRTLCRARRLQGAGAGLRRASKKQAWHGLAQNTRKTA